MARRKWEWPRCRHGRVSCWVVSLFLISRLSHGKRLTRRERLVLQSAEIYKRNRRRCCGNVEDRVLAISGKGQGKGTVGETSVWFFHGVARARAFSTRTPWLRLDVPFILSCGARGPNNASLLSGHPPRPLRCAIVVLTGPTVTQ